jgi:CDP-diacylglycerol--glycerol-3-phosphate 3-phosphatidyltransferase
VIFLLDYFRGQRGGTHALNALKQDFPNNFHLYFYKTPNMSPLLERIMPPRWNEVIGLQHIKAYCFDDQVLLSGANLSHDYFTNRQDRYLFFHDPSLASYYHNLIQNISEFSLYMKNSNTLVPGSHPYHSAAEKMKHLHQIESSSTQISINSILEDSRDLIIPRVQMGLMGVTQEEDLISALFQSLTKEHRVFISSAYLNFPRVYQKLLVRCPCPVQILTSSPEANGFFGAKNVSGKLPDAYAYLEQLLVRRLRRHRKNNIEFLEYKRPDWTFHAKGIWIDLPEQKGIITTIGSSNFNSRSLYRDIEAQAFLVAKSPALMDAIKKVCFTINHLFRIATHCSIPR